jgi:hypothetical protein
MCDPRELIRALRRACPLMVAGACVLRRADANTREPGRGSDAIGDVTSRHRMHGPCFGRGGARDVVDVGESSRRTKSSRSGMRRRYAEPGRLVLHIYPLRPARRAAEPLFLGAGAGYPRRHQAGHRRRYLRGFGADVAQIGASVIDARAGDVGSSHRRNEGGQHISVQGSHLQAPYNRISLENSRKAIERIEWACSRPYPSAARFWRRMTRRLGFW